MATKLKILEVLSTASAEDLTEIRQEIETLEKKLSALRAAERLVDVAVNGAKPRAKPQRKSGPTSTGETREDADPESLAARIYDLIAEEGPLPANVIAGQLRVSPQAVGVSAGKSGWFHKNNQGDWCISKAG